MTLLFIIPPILILKQKYCYFFNFAGTGLLKTVRNYLSRCHESREIGKTKVRIKLNETSLFNILNKNKYTAIFGFCKEWAVEKCTEPVFKMFLKPRNEQNKSGYFFVKHPVATAQYCKGSSRMADDLTMIKSLFRPAGGWAC